MNIQSKHDAVLGVTPNKDGNTRIAQAVKDLNEKMQREDEAEAERIEQENKRKTRWGRQEEKKENVFHPKAFEGLDKLVAKVCKVGP